MRLLMLLLVAAAIASCRSCGDGGDLPEAGAKPSPNAQAPSSEIGNPKPAAPAAGDACKLISKAEAASVVDFALKEGELTVLRGGSSTFCVWRGADSHDGIKLQLFAGEDEHLSAKINSGELGHALAGIDDDGFVTANMVYARRNGRSFFVQISKGPTGKPISPVVAAAIAGTQETPANVEAEYQLAKLVSAKL